MSPEVISVRKVCKGVTGMVGIKATVQYLDQEPEATMFYGYPKEYGPVVMEWHGINGRTQVFVSDAGRHGAFGTQWVRNFYAERA